MTHDRREQERETGNSATASLNNNKQNSDKWKTFHQSLDTDNRVPKKNSAD